jgi:hypothetical protein
LGVDGYFSIADAGIVQQSEKSRFAKNGPDFSQVPAYLTFLPGNFFKHLILAL